MDSGSTYDDVYSQPDRVDSTSDPAWLFLEPSPARVVIDTATSPPTVPTVAYSASIGTLGDDARRDVTSETTFTLDAHVGSFSGNVFTPAIDWFGALATVHASAEGTTGASDLQVFRLRASGAFTDFIFDYTGCGDPVYPANQVVRAMVGSTTPVDVSTRLTDDPSSPGGDAMSSITAVRAMSEGDPIEGCAPNAAKDTNGDGVLDTFVGVTAGTLCFELELGLSRLLQDSIGVAFLDIIGTPGTLAIDHRVLVFVRSHRDGGPC